MENRVIYSGTMKPLDADEFATVSITVNDGIVVSAGFECSDNVLLRACCTALCSVLEDKPVTDLMQMNNNVVYYNCECDLPRNSLYLATIAVAAAKKAALDYMSKNGLKYDGDGVCGCLKG